MITIPHDIYTTYEETVKAYWLCAELLKKGGVVYIQEWQFTRCSNGSTDCYMRGQEPLKGYLIEMDPCEIRIGTFSIQVLDKYSGRQLPFITLENTPHNLELLREVVNSI